MLRITRRSSEDSRILLQLEGEILVASLPVIEQAIRVLPRQETGVVLDLAKVTYVDSRGVEFLRGVLHSGSEIVGASGVLAKMLED